MIKLLSQEISFRTKGQNLAISGRYQDILKENTATAFNYYKQSGSVVRSNHVLVKFINSITVPVKITEERYVELIEPQCEQTARALGIGTAANEPKLERSGDFYAVPEVIIGDITFQYPGGYNPEPVKVLHHPRTDITFTLPDGQHNTNEQGLAVIHIDFIALMCNYRRWQLLQNRINPENPQGAAHFIKCIVLPQMIRSHNAVSFLNRIKNDLRGWGFADHVKRTPFFTKSPLGYERAYREYLIDQFGKNKLTFPEVGEITLLEHGISLIDWTEMPSVPPTRYGKLMQLLTMLGSIEYILMATLSNPKGKNSSNDKYLSELRIFLQKFENERWISDSKFGHLLNKVVKNKILSLL